MQEHDVRYCDIAFVERLRDALDGEYFLVEIERSVVGSAQSGVQLVSGPRFPRGRPHVPLEERYARDICAAVVAGRTSRVRLGEQAKTQCLR